MKVCIIVQPSDADGGEQQICHMIKTARNIEDAGFTYEETFSEFDEPLRVLKSFNELINLAARAQKARRRKLPTGNTAQAAGRGTATAERRAADALASLKWAVYALEHGSSVEVHWLKHVAREPHEKALAVIAELEAAEKVTPPPVFPL